MACSLGDIVIGSQVSRALLEVTMDHRGTINNEIAMIVNETNNAAENCSFVSQSA